MRLWRCLQVVKTIKLSVSASSYESIGIGLSIIVICKQKAFARLVLEQWNQWLNRLTNGLESVQNFVSIQSIASFFSRPQINRGLMEKVC
jgi:hypothetical protein